MSNFGLDGNITLVAGKIPGVVGLITGSLASGEPTWVCFACCKVTIVAIDSGPSDPELAAVKPVAFEDPEKSFLCPSGGGSVKGVPVRLPMKEVTSYWIAWESNRGVRADTTKSGSAVSDTGTDNVLLCSIIDAGIRGGTRSKETLSTLTLDSKRKGSVVGRGLCQGLLVLFESASSSRGGEGKLLREKSLRVADGPPEFGEFG